MSLQQVVDGIKADAQVGQIGNNADQDAANIINRINAWMFKVWRYAEWDWSQLPIAFTLPANTSDYTFGATVGEIIILGRPGQQGVIEPITQRRYKEWVLSAGAASTTDPRWYMRLGRDANNNLMVRFAGVPTAPVDIDGWAKARLTKFAVADIATVVNWPYFPEEMVDVIYDGALGQTLFAAKDARGPEMMAYARDEIKRLWGEMSVGQDDPGTTPPPDAVIFRARKRGGTGVY